MTGVNDDESPAGYFETLRETWGCPRASRFWRWHNFQWGFGPRAELEYDRPGFARVLNPGGGWWMYCTRCGKGLWRD